MLVVASHLHQPRTVVLDLPVSEFRDWQMFLATGGLGPLADDRARAEIAAALLSAWGNKMEPSAFSMVERARAAAAPEQHDPAAAEAAARAVLGARVKG